MMRNMLSALAILSSCILNAEMTHGSQSYFNYDLHVSSFPGMNDRTMICFHGYGDNYKIACHLSI